MKYIEKCCENFLHNFLQNIRINRDFINSFKYFVYTMGLSIVMDTNLRIDAERFCREYEDNLNKKENNVEMD